MNKFIIRIFGCIILFSCQPKQSTSNENTSKFLSEDLHSDFQKIINEFYQEKSHTDYPEFSLLITERYLYLAVFKQLINCPQFPPFYDFKEKFGDVDVWLTVRGNSRQPERFFEMNNLKLNEEIPSSMLLCHPDGYYYRYRIESNNNLILEKKVRIIEGSPEEELLMDEDEKYKTKIIEEPENHN